jgi:transglutaminase-like putative cysteine protease
VDHAEHPSTNVVSASLAFDVTEPATLVLQVAVADGVERLRERLDITSGSRALQATEVPAPAGGRQHLLRAPAGPLTVWYESEISAAGGGAAARVTTAERVEALRPSRYCPSDRVLGLAAAEFGHLGSAADTVRAVCSYVADHFVYTSGSSGPTTDAIDALLSGQGVCRDYAHAVAMLCRAAGVPARLAAVYAPGLSPMDMHAVVEADIDGTWHAWDATRLAPRQSLLRIATGRDAADTAFSTVLDGRAALEELSVTAVAAGGLLRDDHRQLVALGAAAA